MASKSAPTSLTPAETKDAVARALEGLYLDSMHPLCRDAVYTQVARLLRLAARSPAVAKQLAAAWTDATGA